MRGQILEFSVQNNSGLISGDDGIRYLFSGADWRGGAQTIPSAGTAVDFTVQNNAAVAIYPVGTGGGEVSAPYRPVEPALPSSGKSKVAAGVLAILLGGWGIHKFYLGYAMEGLILLDASIISAILIFAVIGIFGLLAIWAIVLIEGILYLTKSDYEFHQTYVANKKAWF